MIIARRTAYLSGERSIISNIPSEIYQSPSNSNQRIQAIVINESKQNEDQRGKSMCAIVCRQNSKSAASFHERGKFLLVNDTEQFYWTESLKRAKTKRFKIGNKSAS